MPINEASIQTLTDHYFSTPREMYPKVTQVAVWGNPPIIGARGWMVLQSPEEVFHSLLIRIGEDITNNDEPALKVWKKCLLNASIEFHYVEKEHDVWLKSANSREEYGTDFSAMYRTGPRRAIEIAAFKTKHEAVSKAKEPLGAQQVFELYIQNVKFANVVVPGTTHERPRFTAGFVGTALTVYTRILSDPVARDLVLEADEEWGQASPYNSLYRLELFTKKAGQGNTVVLHWMLESVNGMVRNKMVDGNEL